MITGFNTDVRFGDKIFHVQTEDKGEKNPYIVSLIYQRGLILDSYRTPYAGLLHSKIYSEALLRRILECQHRQLLQALKSGKYQKGMRLNPYEEDVFVFEFPLPPDSPVADQKRSGLDSNMSDTKPDISDLSKTSEMAKDTTEKEDSDLTHSPTVEPPEKLSASIDIVLEPRGMPTSLESSLPPGKGSESRLPDLHTSANSGGTIPLATELSSPRSIVSPSSRAVTMVPAMEVNEAIKSKGVQGIEICLDSSRDFVAGQPVEISLYVQARQIGLRLENVPIMIKVIGTNLSPRIYSGKTDKSGNLKISFTLPEYKIGSAALILQASTEVGGDQVKYLIRKR